MKQSTPDDRRKAQATLEAMMEEMECTYLTVSVWKSSGRVGLGFRYSEDGGLTVSIAESLDDTFIAALHKFNGTTPPPF